MKVQLSFDMAPRTVQDLGLNMIKIEIKEVGQKDFRIKSDAVFTVLPGKSDSDVILVYKVVRDFESVEHLFIRPIHRTGLIHK